MLPVLPPRANAAPVVADPHPNANRRDYVRQLTAADLTAYLAKPHMQDLIVRVVSGRMLDGVELVTLLPVEWHAQCGEFEIPVKDVDDRGPAESLRVTCPGMWREEFVGCLRVRIPWERWARHLSPQCWAGK